MKLKLILSLIFSGLIIGVLTLGYFYVTNLKQERDTALIESSQYKFAAEKNKETIESLLRDIELSTEERNRVYQQFTNASNRVRILEDKLSRHDLGVLAASKPALVENRVNRGTLDVFRCFEILSGSAITLEEIDATRKSQTNSSCPDIANPNYIGD
jgi:hypothetical protein